MWEQLKLVLEKTIEEGAFDLVSMMPCVKQTEYIIEMN